MEKFELHLALLASTTKSVFNLENKWVGEEQWNCQVSSVVLLWILKLNAGHAHEICLLFSDSSVVWVGGFSTETQAKPYHLWLNPAGQSRANGDKTIDTPLSTLLFVK